MKKPNQSARYFAIEILCRWEERGLPLNQIIERYFSKVDLDDRRDRQLAMSLIYGVIRWRGYLDWVIRKFSKHPPAKMKSGTLQALRVGIFQLLFLDRVPASAAINETVKVLKDMKQPGWLTGFVNAILRAVDRQRTTIPDPRVKNSAAALPESALFSHPEWLIKRWKKRYGTAGTTALCQQNNSAAPLSLRTNSTLATPDVLLKKLKAGGLAAESGKYSPLAVKLFDYHGPIPSIPGFAEGLFQVQDEAAQLIPMLLGPFEKQSTFLDGCAGLGGKTSHLAQLLPAASTLVAIEPNGVRVKKLKENLGRLQLDRSVTIVEGTLDTLLPDNREKFDRVLLDVPCSGLGVIRRNPDIRWVRSPDDLHRYQELQIDLLKDAAQVVAPKGILVYATCSTEPEENDEVIKKFLTDHSQFILSGCSDVLPENGAPLVNGQGFFRTLPGRDDLDGFFAARLIKN